MNIDIEKIKGDYAEFEEKYNGDSYRDFRIISQFEILKKGIKNLLTNTLST